MTHNSKNEVIFKTCLIIVQHFRNLIEADLGRKGFNTRIFEHMLHPEYDFVGIGKSKEVTNDSGFHPEHVVPCAVLLNETCRIIKENKLTDVEIAALLQKHWKIAKITKSQAKKIDYELGYKSTMPTEWKFEDGDTLARLKLAEIDLVLD